MTEQRIIAIETKIAYQEDTIAQLNEVVCKQQTQIDALERLTQQLIGRVRDLSEASAQTNGTLSAADERPRIIKLKIKFYDQFKKLIDMTNNDVLRRIRYTFDFDDTKMIALFALADHQVSRQEISDWLKRMMTQAIRNVVILIWRSF